MADRFMDFDAEFAKQSVAPITLQLFGQTWTLPGSMPAAVPLKVAKWMAAGRDPESDLSQPELLGLAADLIPGDVLAAWFDKGLDVDKLGPVLVWVMREYMGTPTNEPAA